MDDALVSDQAPVEKRKKGVGLFAVLVKSSKFVKALKAAKAAKILLTFTTAGISVLIYSFGLGWWFALGFVVMLFIHEMGHVVALKRKGLHASAPIFIPMLGAVIFAPNMGNRDDEAYMGYAGPLIGGAAAAGVLTYVAIVDHPGKIIAAVAYVALYLNLFNLIPIRPLDGGRVTQAIGPWFRYIGVVMLLVFTLALLTPGLLLIWILILGDFRLPKKVRVALGLGLEFLMVFMAITHIGHTQPTWINILDCFLATFMNAAYLIVPEEQFSEIDKRPQVSKGRKWVWLSLYLGLATVLTILFAISDNYIPKH